MSLGPLRLLLVDAEPAWAHALQPMLSERGLLVQHCNLKEGVFNLQNQSEAVDLIVVDLGLGTQRCQQLAQSLGRSPRRPPLLAVGPVLNEPRRVRLLESWADDVLALPLSVPEFAARCRALWRRHQLRLDQLHQRIRQTVLRHGGLELWVEEHRVCRDGVAVDLTPREFRLLEHLLRHQGQTFDRATLLEQVWGEFSSLELDPKTVDVHIRWLRTKLEPDPAEPQLITTVRGRGYRLG